MISSGFRVTPVISSRRVTRSCLLTAQSANSSLKMLSVTAVSTRPTTSVAMYSPDVLASISYPYSIVRTASELMSPKKPFCVTHVYSVGDTDGFEVGTNDGGPDGAIVGTTVGFDDGFKVGGPVGFKDGVIDGVDVGVNVGIKDGVSVGFIVGVMVGVDDGEEVGNSSHL